MPRPNFKPGKSGNPAGAPDKQESLTFLMRKYLKEMDPVTKVERKELFVRDTFNAALKGNDACRKLVWNYIEGMPEQAIDHTSGGEKLVPYQVIVQNYGDNSSSTQI